MIKHIPDFHLETIMRSGQCFRLNRCMGKEEENNLYSLIAHDRVLLIEDMGGGSYDFTCTEEEFNEIWVSYFDLNLDYNEFCGSVDRNDEFLVRALDYGRGMKILRQDPWETLISFILSQQKNIPAIKKAVETLCVRYGREIGSSVFSFPDSLALAEAGPEGLKNCGIGFRAKYVYDAAVKVLCGDIDLWALDDMCNEELRATLKTIYGVGDKIAACVMLFAYHRLEVFPIDVWIDRVLKERYPEGFPFEKYGSFAGVIQQYLFYYALNGGLGD